MFSLLLNLDDISIFNLRKFSDVHWVNPNMHLEFTTFEMVIQATDDTQLCQRQIGWTLSCVWSSTQTLWTNVCCRRVSFACLSWLIKAPDISFMHNLRERYTRKEEIWARELIKNFMNFSLENILSSLIHWTSSRKNFFYIHCFILFTVQVLIAYKPEINFHCKLPCAFLISSYVFFFIFRSRI